MGDKERAIVVRYQSPFIFEIKEAILTKIITHPIFKDLKVKKLNFYNYLGNTIISDLPKKTNKVKDPVSSFSANSKEGVLYGKMIMADALTNTIDSVNLNKNPIPLFGLIVADFCQVPMIEEVDLSSFTGQINDKIIIKIRNYVHLNFLKIHIFSTTGLKIEEGKAARLSSGCRGWVYKIKKHVETGTDIRISISTEEGSKVIETH